MYRSLKTFFLTSAALFCILIGQLTAVLPGREIITIEDFESGTLQLSSYPDQDLDPEMWEVTSDNTYLNSDYSLKLYGNTWKVLEIDPVQLVEDDIWQIATYEETTGEIHGLGIGDGEHFLFYSFAGIQELDIEEWIPVYQGAFPQSQWNRIELPVADDWFSWYEYYPEISQIVFVNDSDEISPGTFYFDNLSILSDVIPSVPEFEIQFTFVDDIYQPPDQRSIRVQFHADFENPYSGDMSYYWDFGDGNTSREVSPHHLYQIEDDHLYTVFLMISDEKGYYGISSRKLDIGSGQGTFPVTMNFVGDIMLARGYEENGGIIQTLGVEAIFEPTLPILGENADITVANLECPLTTHDENHPTKSIYFKGDPDNVEGLTYAGIDIVTLANNHILDYNYPGLSETQDVLEENGILYSGAGIDSYEAYEPLFVGCKGLAFAFLASSDRTGQYNNYQPYLNAGYNKPGFAYMTPYYIQQQIEEVEETADFIVVEMHAGSEYSVDPGSNYDFIEPGDVYPDEEYSPLIDIPHMWDIEIRHHAIDAGADLVIVHHPHIIQGLELYNGKLIAHSLGNFVFDLVYPETMPSMILSTEIDESGFYHFEVVPVFIDDWIPQPAEGELAIHILDYISRRSRELNTYLAVDRENLLGTVIMDTLSMNLYDQTYTIDSPLEVDFPHATSAPMSLTRSGFLSQINSIEPIESWQYRLGRETIWFGNFEDEGCTLWNLNSNDEWYDENESYEGERSLCHRRYPNSGDNIITNLERRIKRYGDNYSLHGYIKTQNGYDVTIQLRYYETRYQSWYIGTDNVGVSLEGDNPWSFYYADLEIPDNTNYFDIRCNSDCPDNGTAYSWFDNVGLIEWTEWQDYDPELDIEYPNDFYYIQVRTTSNTTSVQVEYTETSIEYPPAREFNPRQIPSPWIIKMDQNRPNPFQPAGSDRSSSTRISYQLSTTENVELSVFNIKGQLVKKLVDEPLSAGSYETSWDGRDRTGNTVGSGIYLIMLKAGSEQISRKCLLIK